MKKYLYIFLGIIILVIIKKNLDKRSEKFNPKKQFEKSYKVKKTEKKFENTEHLDTIRNIYSNYYFNVGFDAQNDWNIDEGMNDHTIFRTFQKDSAITFIINVFEIKTLKNNKLNIWEIRRENGVKEYDKKIISIIEMQGKTKVTNFKVKKSYLKNHTCIKMNFETLIKDLDFEYINTNIIYQTIVENKNYNFGLSVPKIYFELKPEYYENIFRNIYFLHNEEKTKSIVNGRK